MEVSLPQSESQWYCLILAWKGKKHTRFAKTTRPDSYNNSDELQVLMITGPFESEELVTCFVDYMTNETAKRRGTRSRCVQTAATAMSHDIGIYSLMSVLANMSSELQV